MNPETRLLAGIVKALRLHGHTVMRIQTGKVLAKRGKYEHWMQLAEPGTPDLHLPFVPCWLEVKLPSAIAPQSKLSDAQRRWHARALEAGVRVAVVRSAGEAIQQVEMWQREDRGAAAAAKVRHDLLRRARFELGHYMKTDRGDTVESVLELCEDIDLEAP